MPEKMSETEWRKEVRHAAFRLALREETASGGEEVAAAFAGIAVPWDIASDVGAGYREQFSRGAVPPATVIGVPLLWRHDEPIGRITAAEDTETGLAVSGVILPTAAGRDAALLLRGDAVTGLSIGFVWDPDTAAFDAETSTVTHYRADVREISLTPLPAHPTARITATREDPPVSVTVPTPAPPAPGETAVSPDLATREDLSALEARILAAVPTSTPAPLTEREFWTTYRAGLAGDEAAIDLIRRTLADTTIAGSAGLSPTPNLGRVRGALTRGRPTAEAFGIDTLPGYGMSVDVPVITQDPVTGNQATEKAEATSGAFTVGAIPAPVFTEAGATDVSRQFIDRSAPEGLPLLMARFVEIYARRFNGRVLAVAGTTTETVTLTSYGTADVGVILGEAAATVTAALLSAPTFIVAAPDLYFGLAMASGNGYPLAGGNIGTADLASLRFTLAGLSVICDPGIAPGVGYMSAGNGEAITVMESPGAPFTLEADVPAKIGRDVAVYGYGAIAAVEIGGVVKINAPAAP